jgi:aspartate/methionine/tyrosine aminotransferase
VGLTHDPEILGALASEAVLRYEPAPRGLDSARRTIAQYEGVTPEQILITASTSEAYSFLFKLLADPGDEILVPRPSYPLFEFLAALEGVCVASYPLHYHEGWWLDRETLAAAISSRARAIVVLHPNNPTGSFLQAADEEYLRGFGLPLIADEVFRDYDFRNQRERPTTSADFRLNGLSKLLGLPQMKLGWIVASDPAAIECLELIADTYLSVGAPVQHALPKCMSLRDNFRALMMTRLRGNLAALRQRTPLSPLDVEGGWYAVIRLPATRSDEDWAIEFLQQDNVLIQPGYFYDFASEGYAVVSLLTPPEVFEKGLDRICARVK